MEEHKKIEHNMNAHSVAWVKMIGAGAAQRDADRIQKNMLMSDSQPPPLYTTRKDHKNYDDEIVGPPTRPICGATSAANGRLSHMLNVVVSEVWKRDTNTICMSTEEMKSEIDNINTSIKNKRVIIGSTDVKALYPSLDIPFTIDRVCEVIYNSDIKFEGMWYEEIGMYLAINHDARHLAHIGLDQVCPTRSTNRGRPPTVQSMRNSFEERCSKWIPPIRQPSDNEKRTMIVEALRILMRMVMTNHDYTFQGEIKKQSSGGPIGLDLTGSIAQIFMLWWDAEFKNRLSALQLNPLMYKRYVDDINIALQPVESGMKYIDGGIIHDPIGTDEEEEADKRTMNLIKQIGNDIHPSIQLEVDYPTKYPDGKMPILDLKVWIEQTERGSRILHEFYMKPMATKTVINARSAMSWRVKRTVLTQEALRIMLNCSRDLPWRMVANHLTEFSARMQFSGYEQRFRAEVIKSAIHAYNTLLAAEQQGERPLYRPRSWNMVEREKQRKAKKLSWYKKGGEEALMIIPKTPDSRLLKMYQQEVRQSGLPIYIVEKGGVQLKRQLQKSNPFRMASCDRVDCMVCSTGGRGSCKSNGVNYSITCEECETSSHEKVYIGETARTSYIRGREHIEDFNNKRERSVLWKHCREFHQGEVLGRKFRMDVIGVYTNDAMLRQVGEATRIQRTPEQHLMNDKTEWNYVRLPRVTVEE